MYFALRFTLLIEESRKSDEKEISVVISGECNYRWCFSFKLSYNADVLFLQYLLYTDSFLHTSYSPGLLIYSKATTL